MHLDLRTIYLIFDLTLASHAVVNIFRIHCEYFVNTLLILGNTFWIFVNTFLIFVVNSFYLTLTFLAVVNTPRGLFVAGTLGWFQPGKCLCKGIGKSVEIRVFLQPSTLEYSSTVIKLFALKHQYVWLQVIYEISPHVDPTTTKN